MSRFSCKCGKLITDTLSPENQLNYLVNDVHLTNESKFTENLIKLIKENPGFETDFPQIEILFMEEIIDNSTVVYKCHACGRMHVEDPKGSWKFSSYRLEDENS
jgi:hypothetical protein